MWMFLLDTYYPQADNLFNFYFSADKNNNVITDIYKSAATMAQRLLCISPKNKGKYFKGDYI
jgi:hypothetical protein